MRLCFSPSYCLDKCVHIGHCQDSHLPCNEKIPDDIINVGFVLGLVKVYVRGSPDWTAAANCGVVLLRALTLRRASDIVIPPKDAAALADALRRLLEDLGLRRQLGQNAQAKFAENCDCGRVFQRQQELKFA
jgi:glycosyltransferase involved in cell wall biosynthesis